MPAWKLAALLGSLTVLMILGICVVLITQIPNVETVTLAVVIPFFIAATGVVSTIAGFIIGKNE